MHTLARAMGNVLRLNLVIACGFVFAAPPVMATPAPTAHAAVWEEW